MKPVSLGVLLLAIALLVVTPAVLLAAVPFPPPASEAAAGPDHWMELGRQEVADAEAATSGGGSPRRRAKNVVLFIGDGMGVSTVTAARILKGQLANQSGEEGYLAFERFPHMGLAKTYNTDQQTPDSAGTATAYLCGVKTRCGLLGVSAVALRGNCSSLAGAAKLPSFLRMAADAGRAVGIVTTTRLTHASPAAAYCHSVERNWEDDAERDRGVPDPAQRPACPDIARQFVRNAADFRVVLAGGRSNFLPRQLKTRDPATGKLHKGKRRDGANLVKEWKEAQSRAGRRFAYVEAAEDLSAVSAGEVDSVLGLLAPSHLDFHWDNLHRASGSVKQPSLAQMTSKAVQLLSVYGRSTGFVLFVEGGRIDHGHHGNQANRALVETVALSDAVEATVRLLTLSGSLDDTLLMVSADHSHVFTLGHYGMRGQPITQLKYRRLADKLEPELASDDLPFTVLNYANGPGARKTRRMRWQNLSDEGALDTTPQDYVFPAMMASSSESHGGEDVPIYARGPGAHLVHRVHEQTHVAHVAMMAAGLGPYAAGREPPAAQALASTTWRAAPAQASTIAGMATACILYCHSSVSWGM